MRKIKLFTLFVAALFATNMWADPATIGSTGLTWELSGGVLTIAYSGSGTTAMPEYNNVSKQPWKDNRADITSVVIGSGVTKIGRNNFADCTNLTSVTFNTPVTLTTIGQSAFSNTGLTGAFIVPEGVTTINRAAFFCCTSMTSLSLPSTVESIGLGIINGCTGLLTLTMNATTPPELADNSLSGYNENLKIMCPASAIQAYASAMNWIDWWDFLYNASTNEHAAAPQGSGNCGISGDNMTWSFSMTGSGNHLADYEGTLSLSGSGAMAEYDNTNNLYTPWHNIFREYIHHINIAEGITSIAATTFWGTDKVKTYQLPSTLTSIGADAFYFCDNPEAEVYITANPATLTWYDNDPECDYCDEPDDFLSWIPTPFGEADIFVVQATKCYVPSEYLAAYKAKWATGNKKTDVNVFFASKLWDGETKAGIEKILDDTHGQTVPVVTVTRPLNRDGYFATLCFPFSMTADQIAMSSLALAEIKEFTNASVEANALNLEFTTTDHIEAGKPYFVKFTGEAIGDALDKLDFMNVTIDKTAPTAVTHNGVTMTGTFVPKAVSVQTSATDGEGVLFLGAGNNLYWPNVAGNIKPFRAYFSIAGGGPSGAPIRRGMPARIVEKEQTPTGIEEVSQEPIANSQKLIKDGQFFIIKNGVRYNAQGQIVK